MMLGSAVAGFIVSAAADSAEPVARGDSAYANRQLNEAIAHYSEALKESPRDLRALSHLTRAESEQSESEKGDTRDRLAASAVAHARTAVEVAPDSSVSHVWLAVALGRQALHAGPHAKLGMARE
ncbi:MAG: hypothetical protein HYR73_06665, partial [Candidatus Eisenbacteria bacterium]|nr:hypothetical protein [Candidatus Eisenbacteria bacterium]